jgi:Ca-activated chloride channel homolog
VYTDFVRIPSQKHWLSVCLAAIAVTAVNLPTRAAAPASSPDGSDSVIRLTAVVTDRRGQPLTGLRSTDFELFVDGKPQPIESVELDAARSTRRAFAFMLDEFHTPAADSAAVRESLLRFVNDRLRPDDLAFAVKPLDSLTNIKPTMDRGTLRSAISSFEGRKGDYTPRTVFERNYMAQAPAAVAWARGQIVTSAVRAIGLALSETPDVRPAIVLVSDGFDRMRTGRDVPANLQTAVRIANRADAPVYAFAASQEPPPDADGNPDPGLTALRALAAQTGGDVVTGAAAFDNGFGRMVRDFEKHYLLTYRAAHGNDGKFHAVVVGVKRQGISVRARTGYVAPLSDAMRAKLTPKEPLPRRVLRRSSLIQSWAGISPTSAGQATVTLTWEPTPVRPNVAARPPASTILLTASTPDGKVLFEGAVGPAGQPSKTDLPNRAAFDAPLGPVQIDIKILDAKGVVLDTDARDITLPRGRVDAPVIYPPAVIRAQSAREFRAALQNPDAAPTAVRDFRRTERLLIRVPAADASGAPATVTAELLNQWRHPMRAIPALDEPTTAPGITQFDVPLASLAPGEYTVRLTIRHAGGSVAEHVTIRVRG